MGGKGLARSTALAASIAGLSAMSSDIDVKKTPEQAKVADARALETPEINETRGNIGGSIKLMIGGKTGAELMEETGNVSLDSGTLGKLKKQNPSPEGSGIESTPPPDALTAQFSATLNAIGEQTAGMLKQLLDCGFISNAEAGELEAAARTLDAGKLDRMIARKAVDNSEHGSDQNNNFTLLVSLISLLWFSNMIVGCIKGKPVSFVKHHVPFVTGLLLLGTQIPGPVLHGIFESLIAFTAIMGISRGARGITNKVDLSALDEEQAKTVITVLGPLASLITTPAMATIFAPLKEKLSARDKHVAMHGVSNIDGGLGIGDFPFLWVMLQKGIAEGAVWQAKLMFPIMLFHKIWQAVVFKVGPRTIWKHKKLIWNILKGFRFDKKRLKESHHIVSEESALIREFLEYVQVEITRLEGKLGPEVTGAINELLNEERATTEVPASEIDESGNDVALSEEAKQLKSFREIEGELSKVLKDPTFLKNQVGEAVELLRQAMSDGKLTKDQLQAFSKNQKLEEILKVIPGFAGWIKSLEQSTDNIYAKLCQRFKFSENEVEIGRVFTGQSLAIGLLTVVIGAFLADVPAATEGVATATSAFADNYAATAITWMSDNSKALAFSILAGTLTIYGNMANLNFLGKDANFAESVKYARYMIPTLMVAWATTNPEKIEALANNPALLAATVGVGGVAGLAYKFRDKLKAVLGSFRRGDDDSDGSIDTEAA